MARNKTETTNLRMDMLNQEAESESLPLIDRIGIPSTPKDKRSDREKYRALYLLLGSILLERIAFYGIVSNLTRVLKKKDWVNWSDRNSVRALLIFTGTTYMSTIVFAIISDAKLGRVRTIYAGFLLYIVGYILIPVIGGLSEANRCQLQTNSTIVPGTSNIVQENCADWILSALIFIGIGAGAIKSNIAVLGADQIESLKLKIPYSNQYAVTFTIGIFLATVSSASSQLSKTSFVITYSILTFLLVLSAVLFFCGRRDYHRIELSESVIKYLIPVLFNATTTMLRRWQDTNSNDRNQSPDIIPNPNSNSIRINDKSNLLTKKKPRNFISNADISYGGRYHHRIVDDVRALGRAIIVFLLLIPYWMVNHQLFTTFYQQGEQMLTPNQNSQMIVWLSTSESAITLVFLVLMNLFVSQYWNQIVRASLIHRKLTIGMVFACLTMILSGGLELIRERMCDSNLTVFAQLPQYMMMGLAEAFGTVSSFEFAYYTAPRSAQTLFMSLHFASIGLSSFVGDIYVDIYTRHAIELDFNCKSNKENTGVYFFIIAGAQFVFMIIFMILQKTSSIIRLNKQITTVSRN